jgi:signal transduction histidine kinase
MMWLFDTIKGRVVVVLVAFLSLSHLLGLWLYVQKSEEATSLLHDALLAEQIALTTRFAELLLAAERDPMLKALSGPTVGIAQAPSADLEQRPPEGSRAHAFEHLLGVFLNRSTHETIRLAYSPDARVAGIENLLGRVRASAHREADHLPTTPLADIRAIGTVTAEIALSDGSWLRFAAPLLTVTPLSPFKLGAPLAAMLASVLLIAAWVLHRWTQPLTQFEAAAERLGTDIHAPPLAECGPMEVRTAARTFNLMQERIRRFVEDRTAFAAAIAHDLGTPITRLHLRAHEIEDEGMRNLMLSDLEQMRRMITATLGFARSDFSTERPETFDLASLVHSVCDDLADLGHDASVGAAAHLTVHSKPLALRRVVSNLVENAVKYGGRATVEFADAAEVLEIHIGDDGPGIPEHLREEAFKPFRRLGTGCSEIEGSGLGLTVARGITRALGGDVLLTSNERGGFLATIRLPKRPS